MLLLHPQSTAASQMCNITGDKEASVEQQWTAVRGDVVRSYVSQFPVLSVVILLVARALQLQAQICWRAVACIISIKVTIDTASMQCRGLCCQLSHEVANKGN